MAIDPILARILDEAQAKQLPALIAEWADATDDRRWLARALRIDLALLTERPELVVPCLYRRCAFAGEEHGFYTERAPIELASLRALVRGFAAHAVRPWLRALRPAVVPIDGAVIEEYRTSIAGTLWCSDDGERIGVAGDTHVAWDRSTGRRVDGARARYVPGPKPAPWRRAADSSWGRFVIERDGERLELEIGSEQNTTRVHTLADNLVLAIGFEYDYDYQYWLVDTARARIRWQHAGRAHSFAHVGDAVVIGHEDGITTHAVETGAVVSRFRAPSPDDLVVLPDGNVAMRAGDVIRVWSLLEASARSQVARASTNSWTQAAFSPDGERLVTGRLLCDAKTGAFIAHLDCGGPAGWLEGGPPPRCHGLAKDVFAELMPFGLTLWSTHDGKQMLHDRERRGRNTDIVAFDPTGRYHAIWHERGTLQIYHLVTGTLIAELEQPRERFGNNKLDWSADGERLAWVVDNGDVWSVNMAAPTQPHVVIDEPWEPAPVEIKPADGVLVVGDVAIPYDDPIAISSPDQRSFAFLESHYALER